MTLSNYSVPAVETSGGKEAYRKLEFATDVDISASFTLPPKGANESAWGNTDAGAEITSTPIVKYNDATVTAVK